MIEWLRSYKWLTQVYNFFRPEALKYNLPLYQKFNIPKKYYSSISSQDFKHLKSPKNYLDEHDSAIELPKNPLFNKLDNATQKALLPWSAQGYALLEGFFNSDEVDVMNADIESLLEKKQVQWGYAQKIMFSFRQSLSIFQAATHPKLKTILNLLMHKEMTLFQSINFLKGSQQRAHSDFVHMTTFPVNNIIAVWVALEDINGNAGPLHYYPTSHRLPHILNADYNNVGTSFRTGKFKYTHYEDKVAQVIAQNQLKKSLFLAKKGDVFIWHANLLHGGEPMKNPKASRKSMVFHYYSNDAICYHEISQRPALRPDYNPKVK